LSGKHVKPQVDVSVNLILIMDIITEIFTVGRAFDSEEARVLAACAFTSGEVTLADACTPTVLSPILIQ